MKTFLFFITMLAMPAWAGAATINFSWQANPAEEMITGYRIYQDCGSPECIIIDATEGATTAALIGVRGDHSYSLSAYRTEINPDTGEPETVESLHSNYLIFSHKKIIPSTPGKLKATVTK